jgi:hypothetical protein
MAQAIPLVTFGAPFRSGALRETGYYVTQPALMGVVASPGARFTFRATLDFEGITIPDGELTYGGWGEGFIDKRHPHTFVHELVVGVNTSVAGGSATLSAGKMFAAFGTDDPMTRPSVKYPTNHHLSQVLERWGVTGAWLRGRTSVEASVFGGTEPDGPWDFSNITPAVDSWSARLTHRWGGPAGAAPWEASLSHARVSEEHAEDDPIRTRLWNAALRHERAATYALLEASVADPGDHDPDFSVLGEARVRVGTFDPYVRAEYASRPEYPRTGVSETNQFFRYDHDEHAIGATRWMILTLGAGWRATAPPFAVRPFLEAGIFRVADGRGGIDPRTLFGHRTFTAVSVGARVLLGGEPMRMGAYGVLDPMVDMLRPAAGSAHEGMRRP